MGEGESEDIFQPTMTTVFFYIFREGFLQLGQKSTEIKK